MRYFLLVFMFLYGTISSAGTCNENAYELQIQTVVEDDQSLARFQGIIDGMFSESDTVRSHNEVISNVGGNMVARSRYGFTTMSRSNWPLPKDKVKAKAIDGQVVLSISLYAILENEVAIEDATTAFKAMNFGPNYEIKAVDKCHGVNRFTAESEDTLVEVISDEAAEQNTVM